MPTPKPTQPKPATAPAKPADKPAETKPDLIPLEQITLLRFVDQSGKVYYLDARWGGEYVLRPTVK